MANGNVNEHGKNGVTAASVVGPVVSNVQPSGKKRKGRKPDPSVPQVPSTVYPHAGLAIGQQPDNDKALLFRFTYSKKVDGKETKANLYTWALTAGGAKGNFLNAFQPGSETNAVPSGEQLKLLKRHIAGKEGAGKEAGKEQKAGTEEVSSESKSAETKQPVSA